MKITCPKCDTTQETSSDYTIAHICQCGHTINISSDNSELENIKKIKEAIGEPLQQQAPHKKQPKDMPKQLGVYIIQEELAFGAVGKVYLGKHKSLNIPVAIKILSRNISENLVTSQRFIREAQAAAQMAHINIVRILDCGIEDDTLYYAMEYIKNGCTGNRLRDNEHWSEDETLAIGQSVCRALQEAQKHNIVHRDIKPDNIMIANEGLYKLADLGLAKLDSQEHEEGNAALTGFQIGMGTPHYMSPEQAIDAKNVDIRADIYSLGATMFHLSTGQLPYPGSNVGAVLRKHAVGAIPEARQLNPELSVDFSRMINKCMSKIPEDRCQSPKELELELNKLRQRFMNDNPIHQDTVSDISAQLSQIKPHNAPPKEQSLTARFSDSRNYQKIIILLVIIIILLLSIIKFS